MKKLVAIVAMLTLVISGVYAMDLLEDKDMGNVEGQAGISINQYLSSMTITTAMEGLSWGDDNGEVTAGLGGTGAGHLAIRAATAPGGQASLVIAIGISSATPIRMDVDATGIYLAMAAINVTVTTPPRLQISCAAGTVDAFGLVLNGATAEVIGDLAMDNMTVTVATPSVMRIAPH